MPIRYEFDKELNTLHKDLVKMGALIEKSIDDTMEALRKNNLPLAAEVMERDDEIDRMEMEIEKECFTIVARQQPIATDLRDVASILKIVTDLERIGDHCEDICSYIVKNSEIGYVKPLPPIFLMAEKVKRMIRDTIDAFIRKDEVLAAEVCERDDEVDEFFRSIVDDLVEAIEQDPTKTRQNIYYIFITKYLERMADHSTNIAEWVLYFVSGERTKPQSK
ncbi:phosphate signaling complex protein PhoU [Anaerotalea alkaliphila]|uniref:Phosphate-specific transport system accessory protein PhoU n=1 Tax=Anaerotalea alkaliphila TaxID=2662126 RepID=A0A7X5HW66_9FIRM|nr:phosphate signaling complex protein PhoU [Anaerotalea alkaliphila]NDL67770.1 phosphate signaling complex protein PhoU [Anaerotalea alkaliphila]